MLGLWAGGIVAEKAIIEFDYLSEIFLFLAVTIYLIRFQSYEQKRIIDWIKIPLVLSFALFETLGYHSLLTSVTAALLTIYVFDKTVYSNTLNPNWKTALITSFMLTIVSVSTSQTMLMNQKSKQMIRFSEETENLQKQELNLQKLEMKLIKCETDKIRLELELKKAKQANDASMD